jgi:hypothetical protein
LCKAGALHLPDFYQPELKVYLSKIDFYLPELRFYLSKLYTYLSKIDFYQPESRFRELCKAGALHNPNL